MTVTKTIKNNIGKENKVRDYVSESRILTQSINRENACTKIVDNYSVNPAKTVIFPSKPLIDKPEASHISTMEQSYLDELKLKFQRHLDVPSNKGRYPLTASQEIGWFHSFVYLLERRSISKTTRSSQLSRDKVWRRVL